MPVQTDTAPFYNGEALIWENHPSYSRELGVIAQSGPVGPCTVLGQVTATKKYVALAPAQNDGSQNAAAVSIAGVDATAADVKTGVWVRSVVLVQNELNFGAASAPQIAAAVAQLKALGIIVTPGI